LHASSHWGIFFDSRWEGLEFVDVLAPCCLPNVPFAIDGDYRRPTTTREFLDSLSGLL